MFILLLTSNSDLTLNQPKSPTILLYFRHEPINKFNATLWYQRLAKVAYPSTQFVRKPLGATSGRKLKDRQISKVHTSFREIIN